MARTPSPRRRRSRSRDRDRKRRRSRSRERRDPRDERRDRKRSNERDYRRKSWSRSRSRSPDKQRFKQREPPKRNITAADLEGKSEEEQEMLKMMGFCGFTTTKNSKVNENDAGEVHVILKRKYRQYMNRKGGFNRPLDFVA